MEKRPTSITIIAWLIIVMGVITLITTSIALINPEMREQSEELMKQSNAPVMVQYILMYMGLGVSFVSGIAMLNAKNWGRVLYVVWNAFSLIYGFITSPVKMGLLPSVIFTLVIVFFLFREPANKYFAEGVKVNAEKDI